MDPSWSEGMVAIVQGLQDAGLSVTVTDGRQLNHGSSNRRIQAQTETRSQRGQHLMTISSGVQTCRRPERSHSSAHIIRTTRRQGHNSTGSASPAISPTRSVSNSSDIQRLSEQLNELRATLYTNNSGVPIVSSSCHYTHQTPSAPICPPTVPICPPTAICPPSAPISPPTVPICPSPPRAPSPPDPPTRQPNKVAGRGKPCYSHRLHLERRSSPCPRELKASDAFAESLRKYPTRTDRNVSAEVIQRLLTCIHTKNASKKQLHTKAVRSLTRHREQLIYGKTSSNKNIQTYTRSRNGSPGTDVSDTCGRRERRRRRSPCTSERADRSPSDQQGSTSSDFLRIAGCSRPTDVMYLDEIVRHVRNTLRQPDEVCPQMLERYSVHRKHHHGAIEDPQPSAVGARGSKRMCRFLKETESCKSKKPDVIRLKISGIKDKLCELCQPAPCHCDLPPPCSCPDNRPLTLRERIKSIHLGEEFRRLYTQEPIYEACSCQNEIYDRINTMVDEWLKELPIHASSTAKEREARDNIVNQLKHNLRQHFGDEISMKEDINQCLIDIPMWLPPDISSQNNLKEELAKDLFQRLEKLDLFTDIVRKWVDTVPFLSQYNIDKDDITYLLTYKLKDIVLRSSQDTVRQLLLEGINIELDKLPIDCVCCTTGDLAKKLVKTLLSTLPPNVLKNLQHSNAFSFACKHIGFLEKVRNMINSVPFDTSVTIDRPQMITNLSEGLKDIFATSNPRDVCESIREVTLKQLGQFPILGGQSETDLILNNLLTDLAPDIFEEFVLRWTQSIPFDADARVDREAFAHNLTKKLAFGLESPDEAEDEMKAIIIDQLQKSLASGSDSLKEKQADQLIKWLASLGLTENAYLKQIVKKWINELPFKPESQVDKGQLKLNFVKLLRKILNETNPQDAWHKIKQATYDELIQLPVNCEVLEIEKLAEELADGLVSDLFNEVVRKWAKTIPFISNDITEKETFVQSLTKELRDIISYGQQDEIDDFIRDAISRHLRDDIIACDSEQKEKLITGLIVALGRSPLLPDKIRQSVQNWLKQVPLRSPINKVNVIDNLTNNIKQILAIASPENAWNELKRVALQELETLPFDGLPSEMEALADDLASSLASDDFQTIVEEWTKNITFEPDLQIIKYQFAKDLTKRLKAAVATREPNEVVSALKNIIDEAFKTVPVQLDSLGKREEAEILVNAVCNLSKDKDNTLNHVEEWIKTVPFKPESLVNKMKVVKELTKNLKNAQDTVNAEDVWYAFKSIALEALSILPVDGSLSLQEKLSENLADILVGDMFSVTILNWLNTIPFDKNVTINKKEIGNNLKRKLKYLLGIITDPEELGDILKVAIVEELKNLPVLSTLRQKEELADDLVAKLIELPRKQTQFSETIHKWTKTVPFQNRPPVDQNKFESELTETLRQIIATEIADEARDAMKNAALKKLQQFTLQCDGAKSEELADKLADNLISDAFYDTVQNWVTNRLTFIQPTTTDRTEAGQHLTGILRKIMGTSDPDNIKGHLMTAVIGELNYLPMDLNNKDKKTFFNELAEDLVSQLLRLPTEETAEKKKRRNPTTFSLNLSGWMKGITVKLDKEDNEKLVRDTLAKLRTLRSEGKDENFIKRQLKKDIERDVNRILGDKPVDPEAKRNVARKIYNQVIDTMGIIKDERKKDLQPKFTKTISNWIAASPDLSNMDTSKQNYLSTELLDKLLDLAQSSKNYKDMNFKMNKTIIDLLDHNIMFETKSKLANVLLKNIGRDMGYEETTPEMPKKKDDRIYLMMKTAENDEIITPTKVRTPRTMVRGLAQKVSESQIRDEVENKKPKKTKNNDNVNERRDNKQHSELNTPIVRELLENFKKPTVTVNLPKKTAETCEAIKTKVIKWIENIPELSSHATQSEKKANEKTVAALTKKLTKVLALDLNKIFISKALQNEIEEVLDDALDHKCEQLDPSSKKNYVNQLLSQLLTENKETLPQTHVTDNVDVFDKNVNVESDKNKRKTAEGYAKDSNIDTQKHFKRWYDNSQDSPAVTKETAKVVDKFTKTKEKKLEAAHDNVNKYIQSSKFNTTEIQKWFNDTPESSKEKLAERKQLDKVVEDLTKVLSEVDFDTNDKKNKKTIGNEIEDNLADAFHSQEKGFDKKIKRKQADKLLGKLTKTGKSTVATSSLLAEDEKVQIFLDAIVEDVEEWAGNIPEISGNTKLEKKARDKLTENVTKQLLSAQWNGIDDNYEVKKEFTYKIKQELENAYDETGRSINTETKNKLVKNLLDAVLRNRQKIDYGYAEPSKRNEYSEGTSFPDTKSNNNQKMTASVPDIPIKTFAKRSTRAANDMKQYIQSTNSIRDEIQNWLNNVPELSKEKLADQKELEKIAEDLTISLAQEDLETNDKRKKRKIQNKIEDKLDDAIQGQDKRISKIMKQKLANKLLGKLTNLVKPMSASSSLSTVDEKEQKLLKAIEDHVEEWVENIPEISGNTKLEEKARDKLTNNLTKQLISAQWSDIDDNYKAKKELTSKIKNELENAYDESGKSITTETKNKLAKELLDSVLRKRQKFDLIYSEPSKPNKYSEGTSFSDAESDKNQRIATTKGKKYLDSTKYDRKTVQEWYDSDNVHDSPTDRKETKQVPGVPIEPSAKRSTKAAKDMKKYIHSTNSIRSEIQNWLNDIPELSKDKLADRKELDKIAEDLTISLAQEDLDTNDKRKKRKIQNKIEDKLDETIRGQHKRMYEKKKQKLANKLLRQLNKLVKPMSATSSSSTVSEKEQKAESDENQRTEMTGQIKNALKIQDNQADKLRNEKRETKNKIDDNLLQEGTIDCTDSITSTDSSVLKVIDSPKLVEKAVRNWVDSISQLASNTAARKRENSNLIKTLTDKIIDFNKKADDDRDIRKKLLSEIQTEINEPLLNRGKKMDLKTKLSLVNSLLDRLVDKATSAQVPNSKAVRNTLKSWFDNIPELRATKPIEKIKNKKLLRDLSKKLANLKSQNLNWNEIENTIVPEIRQTLDLASKNMGRHLDSVIKYNLVEKLLDKLKESDECRDDSVTSLINATKRNNLARNLMTKIGKSNNTTSYQNVDLNSTVEEPDKHLKEQIRELLMELIPDMFSDSSSDEKVLEHLTKNLTLLFKNLEQSQIETKSDQNKTLSNIKDQLNKILDKAGKKLSPKVNDSVAKNLLDSVVDSNDKVEKNYDISKAFQKDVLNWLEEIPEITSISTVERKANERSSYTLAAKIAEVFSSDVEEKQMKIKIKEVIKEHLEDSLEKKGKQIKPKEVNRLVNKLSNKITDSATTELEGKDSQDSIIWEWIAKIPLLTENTTMADKHKLVDDLSQLLQKTQNKGGECEINTSEMEKETNKWLSGQLTRKAKKLDGITRNQIVKDLVRNIQSAHKELTHKTSSFDDETMSRTDRAKSPNEFVINAESLALRNAIAPFTSKHSDVYYVEGSNETSLGSAKRESIAITKEIDPKSQAKICNLITRNIDLLEYPAERAVIRKQIIQILTDEVGLPENEAEHVSDSIITNAEDQAREAGADEKQLLELLTEEIRKALADFYFDGDKRELMEAFLMDLEVRRLFEGKSYDKDKEKILKIIKDKGGLSEEDAIKLLGKLGGSYENLQKSHAIKKSLSRIRSGLPRKSVLSLQEEANFERNAREILKDFFSENVDNPSPDKKKKINKIIDETVRNLEDIINDPKTNAVKRKDLMRNELNKQLRRISLDADVPTENLTEDLLEKLMDAYAKASASKRDSPMSTSEWKRRSSSEVNKYKDRIEGLVENWLDGLPITEENLDDPEIKDKIIKDLTESIMDHEKYLQLNRHIKPTNTQELDNLKKMCHKSLKNFLKDDDLDIALSKADELLEAIRGISVPTLISDEERREVEARARGHPTYSDALQNEIMSWAAKLPSHIKPTVNKDQFKEYVGDLVRTIQKHKGKPDSEERIREDIANFLPLVYGDLDKNELKRLESSLFKALLKKGFTDDTWVPTMDTNEFAEDNIRGTLQEWLKKTPMYLKASPEEKRHMELGMDDMAKGIKKAALVAKLEPGSDVDELVRDEIMKNLRNVILDPEARNDSIFLNDVADNILGFLKGQPVFQDLTGSAKIETPDLILQVVDNWAKKLAIDTKSLQDHERIEEAKRNLVNQLKQVRNQNHPSSPQHEHAVKEEARKFLKANLTDPNNRSDERYIEEMANKLNKILQGIPVEETNVKSTTKPYKKPADALYEYIEEWIENLPIQGDADAVQSMKQNLASKLINKIGELNMNPDIFNDTAVYQDMLQDEVNQLLDEVPDNPELSKYLPALKKDLVSKVMDARQRMLEELTGKFYKQQLREKISSSLPLPGVLTQDEQASLELLKDKLADAFISLYYASCDEAVRCKYRKKISDELDKFCGDVFRHYPCARLDTEKLKSDLHKALVKVPVPKDDYMKYEVEEVRIRNIINDWMRELPLRQETLTEVLHRYKLAAVLAKRIHDTEMEKHSDQSLDSEYKMNNEITRFINKLLIRQDQEWIIPELMQKLMCRLLCTEQSRKFISYRRCQSMRALADICRYPSTLGVEADDHPKQKKLCHKDAYIGASLMDTCSQTDQRGCWVQQKTCPGVKMVSSEKSCASTSKKKNAACMTPKESPCHITPRVVVKEYIWESPESCRSFSEPHRLTKGVQTIAPGSSSVELRTSQEHPRFSFFREHGPVTDITDQASSFGPRYSTYSPVGPMPNPCAAPLAPERPRQPPCYCPPHQEQEIFNSGPSLEDDAISLEQCSLAGPTRCYRRSPSPDTDNVLYQRKLRSSADKYSRMFGNDEEFRDLCWRHRGRRPNAFYRAEKSTDNGRCNCKERVIVHCKRMPNNIDMCLSCGRACPRPSGVLFK